MAGEIRQVIVSLLSDGRCTSDKLARHLGLSRQTLHRRLREQGETFSSLLDGVRRHQMIDVFTDTAPTAEPVGTIVPRHRSNSVNVLLTSTGDAAIPVGSKIKIYASSDRALDGTDKVLATVTLKRAVVSGGSMSLVATLSNPKRITHGDYYLLAAVAPPGKPSIPFASSDETFTADGHAAAFG